MPGLAERLLYRVAKRWIAGYRMEDAIEAAHDANGRKLEVILNRLGEHTPDRARIEEYTQEYLRLLDSINDQEIDGTISVKPSQLGLAVDPQLFRSNLERILERAGQSKRFIWLDMENSPYTEATLKVYTELLAEHPGLGVCLQANLKRTQKDLQNLLANGGRVRLVKGAYPEDSSIAYKKRSSIDSNYKQLMEMLFKAGNDFAIATHDTRLIKEAERLSKENNKQFEFAMLKGIRDDLKEKLIGQGYRVSEYIPYGPEWYNYSKRRIRERKRNILLLVRSITG
jgi:proline dehydrogenase